MNNRDQMDYDYYRGFDHGVHFVLTELRRLAKTGDVTVEKLMASIDPQWDIAKQEQKTITKRTRYARAV